jgi:decaprenyl-phosphate phosphoribosyltransferase
LPTRPPIPLSLIKLARPWQWGKSVFVLIGPFYGYRQLVGAPPAGEGQLPEQVITSALIAAGAFALVSSGCYVVNDSLDYRADQLHPRKRNRPIAAGHVSLPTAWVFSLVLFALGAACVLALPESVRIVVALCLSLYAANVLTYSSFLKHRIIADVMSLSLGFVLRMIGGCAAVAISPTAWLLNVTLFLSMFLAFGKRLGERRTLAGTTGEAGAHRPVQALYTDTLLQMMVVVTAVITLMTYALYIKDHAPGGETGQTIIPWLWLTLLPATYALLRCIVLLEKGVYDDPTEVAIKDRGIKVAAVVFIAMTVWAMFKT